MLSKKSFVKIIGLIQNFHGEQETLSVMIEKVIDGYAIVTIGNYLVNGIVDILNETLEIKDKNLLNWWLYEDVDKVIYFKGEVITVRTPEELYDYLVS